VITVVRKPVELVAWPLTNQAAMLDALTHLSGEGWRGAITQFEGGWRLELNADNPTRQVIAELGDWLVSDMGLRKLSAEECEANYEEAGS
jgi:hypothetical protein